LLRLSVERIVQLRPARNLLLLARGDGGLMPLMTVANDNNRFDGTEGERRLSKATHLTCAAPSTNIREDEAMRRTLTALALTLTVIAPAFAADDAMSISKQINDQWLAAYNKGDAAALSALYTSDAVLLPQGSAEPIVGQANIQKFYEGFIKQKLDNGAIPITESKMIGNDAVFTAGTWSGDAPGQNGAPSTHLSGTYLGIAVRDGGAWRLRADTWNQMPPPASPPATAATSTTTGAGSTTPNK
jgi:uncharacterized protein (TIGR02246 family)